MKKAGTAALFIAPLVLGYGLFYFLPFLKVLRYSFGISEFSLKPYFRLLQNESFLLAFTNTIRFFAISLPMILFLAFSIAMILRSQIQKSKLLKSVFLLPYIMPVAGSVLLVEELFGTNAIATVLQENATANLLKTNAVFWIAIALYLWKNTGYAVVLLLAGLLSIPKSQYEAARLDGAGALQEFRFITIPQMWYSLFFSTVFSVLNGFRSFREIYLLGGENPPDCIYLFQHFLNKSFQSMNYEKLSCASVLLLLFLLLFLGVFYAFVRKKEEFR